MEMIDSETTTVYATLDDPTSPSQWQLRTIAAVVSHLFLDYGWLRSVREGKGVDAATRLR